MKSVSRIIIFILVILISTAGAHAAINPRIYQEQASEHLLISVVEQSVTDNVTIVRAKVLEVNEGSKAKVGETILIKWTDPDNVLTPAQVSSHSTRSSLYAEAPGPQELSYPRPPVVGTTVPAHLGFTCPGASDCFYWPAASQYSFEEMH